MTLSEDVCFPRQCPFSLSKLLYTLYILCQLYHHYISLLMSSLAQLLRIQVVIVVITHCWGECTYAQVSFTPGLERGRFKFSGITRNTITKLFRFRRCKHPQHKPSQVKPVPVPDSAKVVVVSLLKVPAELALLVGLSARLRCAYAACAVTFATPPPRRRKGAIGLLHPLQTMTLRDLETFCC